MAEYVAGTSSPLTPKLWSKRLSIEALKATWIYKFIGKGDDTLIQQKDELTKEAGDKITYQLRMQPQGDGVQGDSTLEGDEEALAFYSDALIIDQLRQAFKIRGRMTEQRSIFDLRAQCYSAARDWWTTRMDVSFFNQVCGNTAITDTRYSGNQPTIAPDTMHYVSAHGVGVYGDENLVPVTDVFALPLLDRAKERARTITPAIRPILVDGNEWFVCFMHPYQVVDMRSQTNPGSWMDYQKSAMTGGLVQKNPIFDGSLGVYNGIVLHEGFHVTTGVNSTTAAVIPTVRRAVFCGAQACQLAFGRESGAERFMWDEEAFDYGNQWGVAAGSIFGMKKSNFNGMDFSTIVIATYAASH